jgi:hypothetical protein
VPLKTGFCFTKPNNNRDSRISSEQLLALVDEVSVDTVTRGALKDDATFKGVRDVIKKGNRVLEDMLVRRERKYTLFFRLVQESDNEQIGRMRSWNAKVEKAVSAVTGGQSRESYAVSSSVAATRPRQGPVSAVGLVSSAVAGNCYQQRDEFGHDEQRQHRDYDSFIRKERVMERLRRMAFPPM